MLESTVLLPGDDPEPFRAFQRASAAFKARFRGRAGKYLKNLLCVEYGLLEAQAPYNTLILLFWAEINRLKPFFYLGAAPLFTCVDSLLGEAYNRDWSHFFVSE